MIRTNVRINIRIKNIRIFKYSNIFVTLCFMITSLTITITITTFTNSFTIS